MGLINRVVSVDDVEAEAMDMARLIAQKSSAAVKIGKSLFQQLRNAESEAYEFAGNVMATNMMYQDAKAGIGAFVTKQPMPEWTGE